MQKLQARLADSEMVLGFAGKASREFKAFLHRDTAAKESGLREHLESTQQSVGRFLREDGVVRTTAKRFLAEQVLRQIHPLSSVRSQGPVLFPIFGVGLFPWRA